MDFHHLKRTNAHTLGFRFGSWPHTWKRPPVTPCTPAAAVVLLAPPPQPFKASDCLKFVIPFPSVRSSVSPYLYDHTHTGTLPNSNSNSSIASTAVLIPPLHRRSWALPSSLARAVAVPHQVIHDSCVVYIGSQCMLKMASPFTTLDICTPLPCI